MVILLSYLAQFPAPSPSPLVIGLKPPERHDHILIVRTRCFDISLMPLSTSLRVQLPLALSSAAGPLSRSNSWIWLEFGVTLRAAAIVCVFHPGMLPGHLPSPLLFSSQTSTPELGSRCSLAHSCTASRRATSRLLRADLSHDRRRHRRGDQPAIDESILRSSDPPRRPGLGHFCQAKVGQSWKALKRSNPKQKLGAFSAHRTISNFARARASASSRRSGSGSTHALASTRPRAR